MKRLIELIFGSKVSRLQKKSANVFNVFSATVDQLSTINNKILIQKDIKSKLIEKTQAEHAALHSQQESNEKTISKINEFFK